MYKKVSSAPISKDETIRLKVRDCILLHKNRKEVLIEVMKDTKDVEFETTIIDGVLTLTNGHPELSGIAIDCCISAMVREELPLRHALSLFALLQLSKDDISKIHGCILLLWKDVDDKTRAALFDYYLKYIIPDDDYAVNSFAVQLFFSLNYTAFLPFFLNLLDADEFVINEIVREADYVCVPDHALLILLKLSTYYPSVHDYLWNSFHSGHFTSYNCYSLAKIIASEKTLDLAACCVELLSATDIENEWVWLRLYHGVTYARSVYEILYDAFGIKLMDKCKNLCESGRLCWSLLECFVYCWNKNGHNSLQYLESINMNTLPIVLKCLIGSFDEQDCLVLLNSPVLFQAAICDSSVMIFLKRMRFGASMSLIPNSASIIRQRESRVSLMTQQNLTEILLSSWITHENSTLNYQILEKHFLPLIHESKPIDFVLSIDNLTLYLIIHNTLFEHMFSDIVPKNTQFHDIDPLDLMCLLDVAVACSAIRFTPEQRTSAICVCVELLPHLVHSPQLMSFVEGIPLDIGIELYEYCKNRTKILSIDDKPCNSERYSGSKEAIQDTILLLILLNIRHFSAKPIHFRNHPSFIQILMNRITTDIENQRSCAVDACIFAEALHLCSPAMYGYFIPLVFQKFNTSFDRVYTQITSYIMKVRSADDIIGLLQVLMNLMPFYPSHCLKYIYEELKQVVLRVLMMDSLCFECELPFCFEKTVSHPSIPTAVPHLLMCVSNPGSFADFLLAKYKEVPLGSDQKAPSRWGSFVPNPLEYHGYVPQPLTPKNGKPPCAKEQLVLLSKLQPPKRSQIVSPFSSLKPTIRSPLNKQVLAIPATPTAPASIKRAVQTTDSGSSKRSRIELFDLMSKETNNLIQSSASPSISSISVFPFLTCDTLPIFIGLCVTMALKNNRRKRTVAWCIVAINLICDDNVPWIIESMKGDPYVVGTMKQLSATLLHYLDCLKRTSVNAQMNAQVTKSLVDCTNKWITFVSMHFQDTIVGQDIEALKEHLVNVWNSLHANRSVPHIVRV